VVVFLLSLSCFATRAKHGESRERVLCTKRNSLFLRKRVASFPPFPFGERKGKEATTTRELRLVVRSTYPPFGLQSKGKHAPPQRSKGCASFFLLTPLERGGEHEGEDGFLLCRRRSKKRIKERGVKRGLASNQKGSKKIYLTFFF
jgi:hypothetical protein